MKPQVTTSFTGLNRRSVLLAGLAAGLIATQPALAAETIMSAPDAFVAAKAGKIILVDIRTPEEWAGTGIGEGAIALDMRSKTFVQSLVDLREAYPEKQIALICRTGNRSGYVFKALDQQGFTGLVDVAEGMAGGRNGKGWIPRGFPTYAGIKVEIETRLNVAFTK